LDIVRVISWLFSLVVIKQVFDFLFQFILLLIEVLHNSIVLLLFLIIDGLKVSVFLAETSQLLDFRCKLLLLVLNLVFNLNDNLSDLLKCLLLLIVENLVSLRDTLDLIVYIGVSRNTLLLLKVSHELL
jgi:hypothetical protein